MKILLLCDYKIDETQLKSVKTELSGIYKTNTGIKLSFIDEWRDLSNVPKEFYTPEDEGIQKAYITKVAKEIYARYAESVDHIVFLIHRDNWNLKGVWGWNTSRVFSGYAVQQCRFDNKNLANSVGTLYHELMHDHDSFIYTYLGKKVEDAVLVDDWDDNVVHGSRYTATNFGFQYIRHNENQSALKLIGLDLALAVVERRKLYEKKLRPILEEIIRLSKILIIRKRQQMATLRGDIAIRPVVHRCVF
jgi:hypothetical protein